MDLGNTATAIYVATLSNTGQEVVVKFTARYNEVAHRLLADSQLAPTLHFCGRVVGNLYMVVILCGWEVHLAAPRGGNTSSCSCLEESQERIGAPSWT